MRYRPILNESARFHAIAMAQLPTSDDIARAVDILAHSQSILFITGAGISADSGLPTYRGIGGLYDAEQPEEGVPIEELLSGQMLRDRPELTWKYLGQIEQATRGARPNRAHQVIAEMESCFERVWTLTQNIDGLHRQAGAKNVLEIHGTLHELICTQCDWQDTVTDYSRLTLPPRCPRCQAMVRPKVVLFGEMLPSETVERFYEQMESGFDAVFSVGTTSVFPYIAGPIEAARRYGWATVEINPSTTRVSRLVDVKLSMRAAEAMDAIWKQFGPRRHGTGETE
jgi:NAD-dependent deacetylase